MATREIQQGRDASNSPMTPQQELVSNEDFRAHQGTKKATIATPGTESERIQLTDPFKTTSGDCQLKQFSPNPYGRGAKQWFGLAKEQSNKSVDVDDNGTYTVAKGDSLSGVAERILKQKNEHPSHKSIQNEIKELMKLNPELACNPDLLQLGQKLKVKSEAPTTEGAPSVAPRGEVSPNSKRERPDQSQSNMAPTQEETSHWRDILNDFDADGSGTLNFQEAANSLKSDNSNEPSDAQLATFKTSFDQGDLNRNGELELSEFVTDIRKQANKPKGIM